VFGAFIGTVNITLPVSAPLFITPSLYVEPPLDNLIRNGCPDALTANLYVLPFVRYIVGLFALDGKPSPLKA
jgi:hypothetical protein